VQTETTITAAVPGTVPGNFTAVFKRIAGKFIVAPAAGAITPPGPRFAFDIETNGIEAPTIVHCVVLTDLDTSEVHEYGPDQISAALERLSRAVYLTGHNIAGYDLRVLERLHNWTPAPECTIVDTLIVARLILPAIADIDDKVAGLTKIKLGKLRGRYSLEAFGARLGVTKVGTNITDWSKWTPEIQERCVADTQITKALWQFFKPDGYPAEALALEHRTAQVCAEITRAGVPFDVAAAEQLCRQLTARQTAIGAKLQQQFPELNPRSTKQLGALLEAKGWIPEERTPKTNQPKIGDEVLETLPHMFPEFDGLAEYLLLGRRIAALSTGKEAWCKRVAKDGRIHGGLVHIGTPHSRAAHLTPNIAAVPNPKRGKPLATECRSLFRTPNDWVFVCCDQAGLQDRGFAHYLSDFDDGAYAKAFLANFDTHWKTTKDLGLAAPDAERDKQSRLHSIIREGAKSFRYAFLYGVGNEKAGRLIYGIVRAAHNHDPSLQTKLFSTAARPSKAMLTKVGGDAKNKFLRGTPGLRQLKVKLEAYVERFGYLPALDERRVPVRAQYSALNYIVTSSEAVLTKRWLVLVYDELKEKFRYGWDGDVVITLWVHDEICCCCRPEIADEVGKIMVHNAIEPGEFYNFKVPLEADYKIGKSWAGDVVDIAEPADTAEPITTAAAGPAETSEPEPETAGPDPWDGEPDFPDPDPDEPEPDAEPSSEAEPEKDPNPVDDIVIETIDIDLDKIKAHSSGNGHDRGYPHGEQRTGQHVATYLYRDHLGQPHTKIEKRAPAGQRAQYPQSFYVGGVWVNKKPDGWLKVPYHLPELLAALAKDPKVDVFIPEGEKDAETLAALGLIATTGSEGATNPKSKKGSNWTAELNKWLAGVQRVFILEDNDEPGRNFAREKAQALAGIVPDIRIVSFPDVPETEDVTYWLEHGHSKDELLARCRGAERWQGGTLESLHAAVVKMEAIDWLWPGRFALGKLGILAGLPDEGKSSLLCYIAGRLTNTKLAWPNDEGCATKHGTVLLLTCEDSPADTLVPRLAAADADLDRIEIIQMVHDRDVKDGRERRRMFSLAEDIDLLRRKIEKLGDVVAIEIDPVTAYLGTGKNGVDSFRDTDVRAVLGPLVQLADDMRIAIIAIMHFNKKTDVTNALLRISNSLAFGGVARHVFAITKDVANSRRLMSRAKNNIASEENNQTLAFHFATKNVGKDWRDGRPIEAPYVEFEPGYVDVTATEALSAVNENKTPGAVDDAKDFLREMLVAAGGRAPKAEIEEAAEAEKISEMTLRRAKKRLKIQAEKDRSTPDGKWYWVLPDEAGEL
jgi:DNA polymerase I-like protein with 3'-5' exonuclease and polymerase domains